MKAQKAKMQGNEGPKRQNKRKLKPKRPKYKEMKAHKPKMKGHEAQNAKMKGNEAQRAKIQGNEGPRSQNDRKWRLRPSHHKSEEAASRPKVWGSLF